MRHLVSALVLLSLAVACAPRADEAALPEAATPAASMEADMEAVAAVQAQELAAFNSGDTELAYVTDDAVFMPPNESIMFGIDAIRSWATDFHGAVTVNSLEYTGSEVTIAGDWAIERYAGVVTFTPKAGGDPITETLKGIHIYQRQADGSWKMAQDIWNNDAPEPM